MPPRFWLFAVDPQLAVRGNDLLRHLTDEWQVSPGGTRVCRLSEVWRDVNTLVAGDPLATEGDGGLVFLGGEFVELDEPTSIMLVMDHEDVVRASSYLNRQPIDELIEGNMSSLLSQFDPPAPESFARDLRPIIEEIATFYEAAQNDGSWVVKRASI